MILWDLSNYMLKVAYLWVCIRMPCLALTWQDLPCHATCKSYFGNSACICAILVQFYRQLLFKARSQNFGEIAENIRSILVGLLMKFLLPWHDKICLALPRFALPCLDQIIHTFYYNILRPVFALACLLNWQIPCCLITTTAQKWR